MKKILGSVLSIVLGLLFGFFGVMNSVFSDAVTGERLAFIAVIIVIYGLLGLLLGYFFPEMHFMAANLLVSPAILFLTFFLFSRQFLLILLYMALLAFMTIVSARLGRRLHDQRRNQG